MLHAALSLRVSLYLALVPYVPYQAARVFSHAPGGMPVFFLAGGPHVLL